MRKLHIYTLNPDSGYGGEFRVNNLAFYTNTDEKLEVTEIVHVNNNEATFKVNGVNGRIQVPIPYSGYYPKSVFTTDISNPYTLMVKDNINAVEDIAKKLCKDMTQECISLEVNGVLYFVD